MLLGLGLPNRPRSASAASDSNPGRKGKNLQPVFDFTDHVETLKHKYSGRDGTGERRPYVPEHELAQYWTKSRVNDVCKSHAPHLTIKFEVVSERCLRLFSVLAYLDRVQYFDPLLERGLSDAKLPLADADVPQALRAPAYKDVLEGLLEHQWMFCPLVLDYALLTNLHLQPSHILPFREEEEIADGGEVRVYRILVNKECNKLDEAREATEDRAYVLKTYTDSRYRPQYLNEVRALTTLRQSKNENIVGYYGSFVQQGTFNLLLQFADGGNLLDYYGNTPPPRELADVRRFWTSLFAVFKGLHAVHRIAPSAGDAGEYRGIHEDIKPDNIILKKGSSGSPYDFCPLLADFGHSHVRVTKPEDEEEDSEMGIDRQGNQTYGAPECSRHARYLLNLPGRIPAAADIFSTGCVLSDAASWVAFGAKGRDMYRDLRTEAGRTVENFEDPGHYDCFHDAVDRSVAVDDMHNRVRTNCDTRHDDLTPRVLDLVQDHMLLWDWHQRLEARQLWERFIKLHGLPEAEELEVEELEGSARAASRRDRLKTKVRSAGAAVLGITRIASTTPSLFQNLPSPPFSDAPESMASPDGDASSSSITNNDGDAQLLRAPSLDEHRPASPKPPPRPGLDTTPSTKRSSRSLNFNINLPGLNSRSTSRRRPDSPPSGLTESEINSNTVSGPGNPLSSSLSPNDNPSLPRPHTPVSGGAVIAEDAGFSSLDKTHLTLQEALEWRAAWKAYGQATTTPTTTTPGTSNGINLDPDTHKLIRSMHSTLWGRDHIFVVDTSRTMHQHKTNVELAFTALSYLVKPTPLNKGGGGIWLALGSREGSSTPIVYRDTKTSKLLAELEKCRYDRIEGLMEVDFTDLVQGEIIPRLPLNPSPQQREGTTANNGGSGGGGRGKEKALNPLSVIVLTDGQWGSGPDGAGMQNPIWRLIETVKEHRLKRTQVMVQFIRFGDGADGIRHLRHLVNFGRKNECDIIDTRPITGNVCDMLIGSLSNGRDHGDG